MEGPFTPEELEYGRWLFCQACNFMRGVQTATDLPDYTLPEVAFVGCSNVGKSSLINALTSRQTLTRTSHKPGCTQQLNFFDLGQKLCIVDLPGYGYAEASKEKVIAWQATTRDYLQGRPTLLRVYLLLDSRRGLKEHDRDMMALLDRSAVSYQLVLTKGDKLQKGALEALQKDLEEIIKKHSAAYPQVLITSSRDVQGIEELRAAIGRLVSPALAC